MLRKTLLVCGILSSLLYAAMNVFVAMRWQEYSAVSQTVSELSAIAAPTRSLWTALGAAYTALVIAFGWGLWISRDRNPALRPVGRLVLAYGALGFLWPLAPMHSREVLAAGGGTPGDTMHLILSAVSVTVMLFAIHFAATAFGERFRTYSIVSLVAFVVFGSLTFLEAPGVSMNLPTPWLGVWERINIGVFLLWVIVLAVQVIRSPAIPAATCGPAMAEAA
jgi:hypothetical protein